ncbi:imidazole glycerol phosphate synthase subunit HisH [Caenispirillum bisanense]|uniref:imidazole glycerol phosphate synthase subunit HisH n=1 Tax=Caenispirillum bisanense TaxID=414052 RepID=UPI0031D71180
MIVIVDYEMGNIGSIGNMFKRLGIPATISRDPGEIGKADRLLIPGVGAFDQGMENLERLGLRGVLDQRVLGDGVPVLGICLGMQLMTRSSEEGTREGLGWIDARTVHFRAGAEEAAKGMKFPHIGWNFVTPRKPDPLIAGLPEDPRFYFVHTYKVECADPGDVLMRTWYGDIEFTAAFQRANIAGFQCHPEKSHKFGMQLFTNFAKWAGRDDGSAAVRHHA